MILIKLFLYFSRSINKLFNMRKILLLCFLALGISANAQITVDETFEASPVVGFAVTGGYQPSRYTDGGCGGESGGYGSNIYGTTTANNTVNIIYTKPGTITANGKKIDIAFDYTTVGLETVSGTMTVAYSKSNSGNTWTTVGTIAIPSSNPDFDCLNFTGTIPESVNVDGQFRLRIQAVTGSPLDDFYFFIDNLTIIQETLTAPSCATVVLPANGVNPNNGNAVTWPMVAGASGYKVYFGTAAGTYDIAPGTLVTTNNYILSGLLANTSYFVKVVPTNANGDATGCSESTFTTGAATYCNDVSNTASDQADFEKISNVSFAGINNSSTSTSAYEDFSTVVGTVEQGKPYVIAVTISSFDSDLTSVWIDYNHDNVFSDSEKVVLTPTAIAAGTINIPSDAQLGNTRMRVRTSYTLSPPACGAISYGQAEDYTINIIEDVLAVPQVNKSRIAVYPNPFTDVLKISDIEGVKSISINDISGRQLKTLKASAVLALSDLKTGVYIVNLNMEDGSVHSIKAIKK